MRCNVAAMRASLADQRAANGQRAARAAAATARLTQLKVCALDRDTQALLLVTRLDPQSCTLLK